MTTKVLLMLHDFVQCDFVLDQQSNFDIKLIDILFGKFVLPYVLDNSLAKTFKFCK